MMDGIHVGPGPWRRKPLWAVEHDSGHDDAGPSAAAASGAPDDVARQAEMVPLSKHHPNAKSSTPSSSPSSSGSSTSAPNDHWSEDDKAQQERRNYQQQRALKRHLTLTDLLSIGVGGTVGSGVFVLCGLIARNHAGPATCLSWLIAGVAASLSGTCYAELAGRIPTGGSTYIYAYVTVGELAAVVAAALLTLEYGLSGAAVARSWGDKVLEWVRAEVGDGTGREWVDAYLDPGYGVNPMAFVVSAVSVAVLLNGTKESKAVTNFFTLTKVGLVAFMTIMGFVLTRSDNWVPLVPPAFGVLGVFRGATSSFFGFVGFDEVACLAGEAINPRRDMPRAILMTIASVSILYFFAAAALTGMQPYEEISDKSGFPKAFRARGIGWAAEITAFGEVFTLPVVVLISLMAQPRLQHAVAQDGLLPPIFGEIDEHGNLRKGTLIAGVSMTLVATFVPFKYLDDLISSGILVAFNITDASVILMRHESPADSNHLLEKLLVVFNVSSFTSGLLLSNCFYGVPGRTTALISCVVTVLLVHQIARRCPRNKEFGGKRGVDDGSDCGEDAYFKTPFVPYLPCVAIFVNWYLISQLEAVGMLLLLLYIGLAAAFYFAYGARHSLGNLSGWGQRLGGDFGEHEAEDSVPLRSISLPRVAPIECKEQQ